MIEIIVFVFLIKISVNTSIYYTKITDRRCYHLYNFKTMRGLKNTNYVLKILSINLE